ncbi:MAG: M13 family metallopeptidase [Saprospiraceae bacterium]
MKKVIIYLFGLGLAVNAQAQSEGIHLEYMNQSVKPGDDFYEYAIGNWRKMNPVPPSESRWGSFNEVNENNKKVLKEIMKECTAKTYPMGSSKQKIGDYYKSGMDSVLNNRLKASPLNPYFAKINGLKTKPQLVKLLGEFMTFGSRPLYGFFIDQDQKISSKLIPYFSQGGLTLPDRDYYLKEDADKKKIREEYVKHVSNMFVLLGKDKKTADQAAIDIIALETKLAEGSMDKVTRRNPYKVYNKMTLADFSKITKNIDWNTQTALYSLPATDSVIVGQPDYFKKMDELISSESIATWKTYLTWRLLNSYAGYLSDDFSNESFNFSGKVLAGTKVRKPRAERVMMNTDGSLGELVGEIYVEMAFKPEAKKRMLELVKNLQETFGERIQKNEWMGAETKVAALEKLNTFMVKIGYPDKWEDYSKLEIKRQSYAQNVISSGKWRMMFMMEKYKKGVDRTEWGMSPQTVNAYYNPTNNEIVFPAGILQPPFFYFNADDAVNYGAIGGVIGHEMTHGFDDEGRKYDSKGNLKEWWTKEDSDRFDKKAEKIIEQFNNYKILDSVSVNGKLTLGENLADLGGIAIAYAAFKKTEQGKKNEKIDGLTSDQRFFISWANCWKNNTTAQTAKMLISTDPHAPANLRGFAPLTHHDAFYEAFDIKPTDKLYLQPKERVTIW